jgi:hypothetical protein
VKASRRLGGIGAVMVLGSATPLAASTILQDVLAALGGLYGGPLVSMFGNGAFNAPQLTAVSVGLQAQDQVIIGYDPQQVPVYATAGATGLIVTPAQAASLQSGLAAGLYPPGSALYSLPPAGQLSLYDRAVDGAVLARAEEMLLTRIDGHVSNVVTGMLFPDLAPTRIAAAQNPAEFLDLATLAPTIDSTVLGAVNTGTVVSDIKVVVSSLPDHLGGLGLSEISIGANALAGLARTESALAVQGGMRQLGGDAQLASVSYNMAVNAMDVNGRIQNQISATTMRVGEIASTVLGAVNGGSINLGGAPQAD